ncbi:inositol-3-phosphate synthase [Thermodesulfobacteriota bacterium]
MNIAIVGCGNCAASLVQSLQLGYDNQKITGFIPERIAGETIRDIHVVAAIDVDARKVGQDLSVALTTPPNVARTLTNLLPSGVIVNMGPILDGVAEHMISNDDQISFQPARETTPVDVASLFRDRDVDVVVNLIPVGSRKATEYYAKATLKAGAGFVNGIPVFIASDQKWASLYKKKRLPLLGDDMKSQFGATRIHRALVESIIASGLKICSTDQENWGGNTDFKNMIAIDRRSDKLESKHASIATLFKGNFPEIYAGPARGARGGFVSGMGDRKRATINIECVGFGGVPIDVRATLECDDSPNAAAVLVDVIRIAAAAKRAGIGGPLEEVCAKYFKHPPVPYGEDEGRARCERWITLVERELGLGENRD